MEDADWPLKVDLLMHLATFAQKEVDRVSLTFYSMPGSAAAGECKALLESIVTLATMSLLSHHR